MRMPFQTPVEFESSLSSAEIATLLQAALPRSYQLFVSRVEYPVSGKVNLQGCSLRYRTWHNNSFQRRLRLHFVPTQAAGCHLKGQFEVPTSVLLFAAFWFFVVDSFLLIAGGDLLKVVVIHKTISHNDLLLLVPAAMLLFVVLIVRFGLWLSKRTEPELLTFLQEILATTPPASRVPGDLLLRPRNRG